ncbi:MAG: YbaK/EbsC family protein [Pseudomonadota bacterium]
MSKSLARVLADAEARGLTLEPVHLPEGTLTAQAAADATGTTAAQIIKSILFRVAGSEELVLFLTAGSNRVDVDKAAALVGAPLEKADAATIRKVTGFAIGGVSPLGHKTQSRTWMDPTILTFETVWAAAGTPHHVFEIAPETLRAAVDPQVADFVTA